MKTIGLTAAVFLMAGTAGAESAYGFESDSFQADGKTVTLHFIGHGTLMVDFDGTIVHVDPVSREADYSKLPDADLILITHEHQDHLDPKAVGKILKSDTVIVANPASAGELDGARSMKNGDSITAKGIFIESVPAYNTTEGRDKFHPKDRDNGYVLDLAGLRVYIAGDTEPIEEMKALKNIDVAFLPMNQPYTMTPEQAAEAVRMFRPKVVYPYHFGQTDPEELVKLLAGEKGIEVRVRPLE